MLTGPRIGYFGNVLILIFFILLSYALALYQGQDINWDLLNYHLYNGYAITHWRYGNDIAPALIQTYLNPLLDVLNFYIISLQKPMLCTCLLSFSSGFAAFIAFKLAELLFEPFTRRYCSILMLSAVLLGYIGVMNISLLGTTTNDVIVSLFVLTALLYLLRAIEHHQASFKYILVAGLLSGMAAGFKLTAACYSLGLILTLLLSKLIDRQLWQYCLAFVAITLIGFLSVNGFWMLYLFKQYQSPLFPYYNNVFHSPYAPYLSFNLSPSGEELHWRHFLFLPVYLAFKTNAFFSERTLRDAHLFIVLIFFIFYFIRRLKGKLHTYASPVWEGLATFFIVSYIIWLMQFAVYRYILPLELISGLVIVYVICATTEKNILRAISITFIGIVLLFTTVYPSWGRKPYGSQYISLTTPIVEPHAKILLDSFPSAYVVIFFPATSEFIGLTFLGLGETFDAAHLPSHHHNLFLTQTIAKLNQTRDPIYSLAISKNHPEYGPANNSTARSEALLKHFGFVKKNCQKLASNIGDEFELCRLI